MTLGNNPPYPIPVGRGRWRFTLHTREYLDPKGDGAGPYKGYGSPGLGWAATQIAELTTVRSRRIEQTWCAAATITFTIDGHDPLCALIDEMTVDVYAWRWDDWQGRDVCVGRFIIDHSEDIISEQAHVVVFGGHDYFAMLERRVISGTATDAGGSVTYTAWPQDTLVEELLWYFGVHARTQIQYSSEQGGGYYTYQFLPGSYLPLSLGMVAPNGTARVPTGVTRDRVYPPGGTIAELIDNLAKVQGGFDYDVLPAPEVAGLSGPKYGAMPEHKDALRIFYPAQGVTRSDVSLVYGGNVSSLTRTVSSVNYANRVWGIGNKGSSDPNAWQLYDDEYNDTATDTVAGLWMDVLNLSDVSQQKHLDEQTLGALNFRTKVTPSYSLSMRPGSYRYGYPNMGDTVQLVVQSGRLNVVTNERIMGIDYDIGDDGDEDVELTVGRTRTTVSEMFKATAQAINAIARK